MDAASVIASAIRAGVPMFNAGDAAGCAAVYSNAIVDLMGLVPASCPALVDALEKLAQARGARHLVVESSDTAEPFFARRGYSAQQRNTIEIDGVWLGNTTMRKALPANDSAPPPRRMQ